MAFRCASLEAYNADSYFQDLSPSTYTAASCWGLRSLGPRLA